MYAKYLTSFAASLHFSLINVCVQELITSCFPTPCREWAWLRKERESLSCELCCSPVVSLPPALGSFLRVSLWSAEKSSQAAPLPAATRAPLLELAHEQVILKASQRVWERLSSAKHDWVVLVLFRGVEARVANHLRLNNLGMSRWLLDRGFDWRLWCGFVERGD